MIEVSFCASCYHLASMLAYHDCGAKFRSGATRVVSYSSNLSLQKGYLSNLFEEIEFLQYSKSKLIDPHSEEKIMLMNNILQHVKTPTKIHILQNFTRLLCPWEISVEHNGVFVFIWTESESMSQSCKIANSHTNFPGEKSLFPGVRNCT